MVREDHSLHCIVYIYELNVAVPFNNIEHRDANIVHKITTQYLALKGGTPLRDRRDRRLPLRDHGYLCISPAPKPRWIGQVDRSKAKTIYKANSYST